MQQQDKKGEPAGLSIDWSPPRGKGHMGTVVASNGGDDSHTDRIDILKSGARSALMDRLAERWSALKGPDQRRALKVDLERLAADEAARVANAHEGAGEGQPEPADLLAKMPPHIVTEARAMLEAPDLLERIGADFSAIGIAGERALAGTIYLAGVSRLLARPLAILIQGPSSSGKSHVLRAVAQLFPPEAIFSATTLSTLSLYYATPGTFRHRFVVCGERSRRTDDEQTEVTRALREMLSEGRIQRLVTVKKNNGPPTAESVQQEGPIAYAESSTLATADVFREDFTRMLLLATDETPQQTKAVLYELAEKYQRGPHGTPAGIIEKHHAAQRLLRPMPVKIPYATALVELLPSTQLEMRRGAGYILGMVEASALLQQYQRQETGDGELIATLDDYRLARALLAKPLGRLVGREVSDGALRFLGRLIEWFGVGGEYSIPEAKARETHSVSGVYGWNSDLADAGLVKVVEEKRGNAPARWRIDKSPEAAAEAVSVLPKAEELENTT